MVIYTVGYSIDGIVSNQADSVATNRGFGISARDSTGLNFPVPVFRPTTNNSFLALDLMPKGSPAGEFTNNGITWLDLCSADLMADSSATCNTARVGIRPTYAEFGSRLFNGASAIPVKITVQTGASTFRVGIQITTAMSVILSDTVLGTSVTDGFTYLPSCAGVQIGTPTTQAGTVPVVIDTTNGKFGAYLGGAWKWATFS